MLTGASCEESSSIQGERTTAESHQRSRQSQSFMIGGSPGITGVQIRIFKSLIS